MKRIVALAILFACNRVAFAQQTNLSQLTEEARNEYLLRKSKEAIMNFGSEWYQEPMTTAVFCDLLTAYHREGV